jgi:polysaccharide pyruvyl transferase WcaK-like protein
MVFRTCRQSCVVVFDEGTARRNASFNLEGAELSYQLCGERPSRRFWQDESLWNIRVSTWLGGAWNESARAILEADAVLDLSGGDSFTDLYGPRRFRAVTLIKQIVLENNIPLILLPQTYGPFTNRRNRRSAESIVRRTTMAWARDQRSFETLRDLVGSDFDPSRHCSGVDVAFALDALKPTQPLPKQLQQWLEARDSPVVGINVSGLIYNNPQTAKKYGLQADYRQVIKALVTKLLAESDCRIVLVPHVITPPGHYESDIAGCQSVVEHFQQHAHRISVLPAMSDPRHIKWVIGQFDWFCGTRMHSTIAALSSCVPAMAIAYSLKTLGVFETSGLGHCVADLRQLNTDQIVATSMFAWRQRDESRQVLREHIPRVVDRANDQMHRILHSRGFEAARTLSEVGSA